MVNLGGPPLDFCCFFVLSYSITSWTVFPLTSEVHCHFAPSALLTSSLVVPPALLRGLDLRLVSGKGTDTRRPRLRLGVALFFFPLRRSPPQTPVSRCPCFFRLSQGLFQRNDVRVSFSSRRAQCSSYQGPFHSYSGARSLPRRLVPPLPFPPGGFS